MKPCSSALAAFLASPASRTAQIIDLYTFRLQSGEVLRCSGWTTALSLPATSFPQGSLSAAAGGTFVLGPRFSRSKVSLKAGVDPGELDIEIYAGAGDLIGSFTWGQCARMGIFDGATVEVDRLFSPATGGAPDVSSLGCMIWFYGRVAECDIGRTKLMIKVKDLRDLLQITQCPRRIYQSSCNHVFGAPMCGYDRAAGKNAAGDLTGFGQMILACRSDATQAVLQFEVDIPVAYEEGTVIGASGANIGISRTIASAEGGQVNLFKPFLYPVAGGDEFTLLPGCDHTSTTCNDTFNNIARYGGFPYIPPPENAV